MSRPNPTGMNINPYQPPAHEEVASGPKVAVVRRLRGPSTGLLLLLALQIIGYMAVAASAIAKFLIRHRTSASPIEIALVSLYLATMLFMMWSMLQIRRLQRLRSGRVAAGLACLPLVTPFIWLGIPFGIWLSILLWRSTTVDAFANGFPERV